MYKKILSSLFIIFISQSILFSQDNCEELAQDECTESLFCNWSIFTTPNGIFEMCIESGITVNTCSELSADICETMSFCELTAAGCIMGDDGGDWGNDDDDDLLCSDINDSYECYAIGCEWMGSNNTPIGGFCVEGSDQEEDEGPPQCLQDCEGIETINPDENPYEACDWIISNFGPNNFMNQCAEDCDNETMMEINQYIEVCFQCLADNNCTDVFGDEDNDDHPDCDSTQICAQVETCIDGLLYSTSCGPDNCDEPIGECNGGDDAEGYIYGYVEYIWGDAIERVVGAHVIIQSISDDTTMIDVYETITNEMGEYGISLPEGGYMVTAYAYDDSETHDIFLEGEYELNFQLGEFDYWENALSGLVNGSNGPNSDYYPLSGAQVRAESSSTGEMFEINADEGGYYWLSLPYPDMYSVTVSHNGHQSFTQNFEVFGIVEADFFLNSQMEAEALLSLGDGYGNTEGFTVPLYLNSSQSVSGIQFAVIPMSQTWDYYFIPGEVEVLNDCFSGDGNDVYGQLWGIIFSLEGCVYEPGEDHHVANLSFTIEGDVPPGTQLPLVFNYTLASDPNANEIPSSGEGSIVTFGQLGDVNGDGLINVVDIVNMVNFALQIDEPAEYESWAADLNQDGNINVLDIISVVNIILYGYNLQRADSGNAEIYHNEKEINIEGTDVAGFQIVFSDDIDMNKIQIPDGWVSKSHGHSLLAYTLDGNLLNGRSIITFNQSNEIVDLIVVDSNGEAIISSINTLPNMISLNGNYPNPFNPETSISYTLSHDSQVILSVYDLSGRLVETLVDKRQYSGEFLVSWSPHGLPSGIYIARLIIEGKSFTQKMMFMK